MIIALQRSLSLVTAMELYSWKYNGVVTCYILYNRYGLELRFFLRLDWLPAKASESIQSLI